VKYDSVILPNLDAKAQYTGENTKSFVLLYLRYIVGDSVVMEHWRSLETRLEALGTDRKAHVWVTMSFTSPAHRRLVLMSCPKQRHEFWNSSCRSNSNIQCKELRLDIHTVQAVPRRVEDLPVSGV